MRTHLDFFSGLGSWAIAAANNGLKTIALCEREEWLAKGLEKIWKVPCYRDINNFPSQDYANRVWLLTGSPPCQPASRAGKQGGAGDVRWLWPQTIRHTEIIKPTWFCYENPHGIADVGLDGIIVDLERIGYEVQPIRIPACAVDSPQDRDRFWILGHSIAKPQRGQPGTKREQWTKNGHGEPVENGAVASGEVRGQPMCGSTQGECGLGLQQPQNGAVGHPKEHAGSVSVFTGRPRESCVESGRTVENGAVANSQGEPSGGDEPRRGSQGGVAPGRDAEGVIVEGSREGGHRKRTVECGGPKTWGARDTLCGRIKDVSWSDYQWIACPDRDGAVKIRRAPTGLYELAYGVQSRIPRKFHSKLIAALGNAIVWQVASEIISAMIKTEKL